RQRRVVTTRMCRQSVPYIRPCTASDASTVNALRHAAYERATEFQVIRPSLLEWGARDGDAVVLGAWNYANQLVSTMRGAIVANRREAEAALTCTVDCDAVGYPALVLSKGATASAYSTHGLNSVLRYYFLDATIGVVRSALGLVYANAARTR